MTEPHDTGLKPPPDPYLKMPREEAVVDGAAVRFEWEAAEGATAYLLEVAADTAFETLVFEQTVADDTSLTVRGAFPADGTTFFWRVMARNAAGDSYGEAVESFISATPEAAAQHVPRPDRAEMLGPLTELIHEGTRETSPAYHGAPDAGDVPQEAAAVTEAADDAAAYYEAEEALGVQHEGVGVRGILGFIFLLLVFIALAITVVFFWATDVAHETELQAAAALDYPDLREVEARAAGRLARYEVVDGAQRIYRIPIDRAIDLMVDEAYRQPGGGYSSELRLRPGD